MGEFLKEKIQQGPLCKKFQFVAQDLPEAHERR